MAAKLFRSCGFAPLFPNKISTEAVHESSLVRPQDAQQHFIVDRNDLALGGKAF